MYQLYMYGLMNFDKCVRSCNHLHNQDAKRSCHPESSLLPISFKSSLPSKPQETTDSFYVTAD